MARRRVAGRRGELLNKALSILLSLSLVSGWMLPSAAFADESSDTSSAPASAEDAWNALAPGMVRI